MVKDRLVFEKTNGGCCSCFFEPLQKCEDIITYRGGCGYKLLAEEPEKVQTEYEWKKERFDLMRTRNGGVPLEFDEEFELLNTWLHENKPEIWETCTKENTKVGDEVRVIRNRNIRTVAFIFNGSGYSRSKDDCVITNSEGDYADALFKFEINVYKQEVE